VNESQNFLSKLSTTVPKSTPKGTQTKATKTRATKSQENLNKFHRSLEKQRKRRNSNRRSNGRETDKTTQDKELQTVCYSTPDSPLQYHRLSAVQKSETELDRNSFVLGLKTTATVPPDSPDLGAGLSTSTDTEQQRKHRKESTETELDRLFVNCESAKTERPKNRLQPKIFRFAAKSKPIATKI
jgi:hypothetical protein